MIRWPTDHFQLYATKQSVYLLFKIASFLLVYEDQVEVVPHWELLVYVPHCRRHLIAGQKQPDGDGLSCDTGGQKAALDDNKWQKPSKEAQTVERLKITSDWSTIHDLILRYGIVLVVDVGSCAGCLSLDDVNLHVFDLNPHQQEVNLPYNHIFEVIPASRRHDPSISSTVCSFQSACTVPMSKKRVR